MKRLYLLILAVLVIALPGNAAKKSLKGPHKAFVSEDAAFTGAYVDEDRIVNTPVRCRLVHGGFEDGTRFYAYFPLKKEDFQGRFFQYITPSPEDERAASGFGFQINPIVFSITHGAYFLESNQGGVFDPSDESTRREATIGAYRASAACAEFSRYLAQLLYDCERPRGYCYGGSGGAFRTAGGAEATKVWDGAVPFVMGSPQAMPNVFTIRMRALRVLGDKLDGVADAMRPGGSGNPYEGLTAEQREVLSDATRMGFPIKAWGPWRQLDPHGYRLLHGAVVQMDPTYFRHDFWETPGYAGAEPSPSLIRDHIQLQTRIKKVISTLEAIELGIVPMPAEDEKGTADRAWAYAGASERMNRPAAVELEEAPASIGMGADLVKVDGPNAGHRYQLVKVYDSKYVTFESVNSKEDLALLKEGDEVILDNSDFLAVETYYRHQVPTPDFYVWDYLKGVNGQPIYPQRPVLLGPILSQLATGIPYDGDIKCKVIVCCSVWDREAFPWQGDWYRKRVEAHLGAAAADNFRLWYTDRATHADAGDDPRETVPYMSTVYQALLDLDDWVAKGIAPPANSEYRIEEGQVILPRDGVDRGGIQPSITASVDGSDRADVPVGQNVTVRFQVQIPRGTGSLSRIEWSPLGDGRYEAVQPEDLQMSADGLRASFSMSAAYDKAGTYFPTARVFSERHGDTSTPFTRIPNLAMVRVVVK